MTTTQPYLATQEPVDRVRTSREFETLTTAARLARRGAFFIALYNTPASRDVLIADLRRRIAPTPVFVHHLSAAQPNPLDYLASIPGDQRNNHLAVCLLDLDTTWPDGARMLDRARDILTGYPHALILWLLPGAYVKLSVEAPHFLSRHSGVFDLRLPSDGGTPPIRTTVSLDSSARFDSLAEWERSRELYTSLLEEYQSNPAGNEAAILSLHLRLAELYAARSEYSAARTHFQQALAMQDLEANAADRASLLLNVGRMRYFFDEYDDALRDYSAALALFHAVGARLGEANTLKAIGDVQNFRKELDDALASYNAALALFRAVGDRLGEANTLKAIGFFKLDSGQAEDGLETLDEALSLYHAVGDRVGQANIHWGLGLRVWQNGQPAAAEPLITEAVRLGNEIAPGQPQIVAWGHALAQLHTQIAETSQEAGSGQHSLKS